MCRFFESNPDDSWPASELTGQTARLVHHVREKKERSMTVIDFLLLLLIAGICGSLAQAIVGYSHGGCLVAIALGFIGALLGSWIARSLQLPEPLVVQVGGKDFPVVWSIVGATLFSAVLSLITLPRV